MNMKLEESHLRRKHQKALSKAAKFASMPLSTSKKLLPKAAPVNVFGKS